MYIHQAKSTNPSFLKTKELLVLDLSVMVLNLITPSPEQSDQFLRAVSEGCIDNMEILLQLLGLSGLNVSQAAVWMGFVLVLGSSIVLFAG